MPKSVFTDQSINACGNIDFYVNVMLCLLMYTDGWACPFTTDRDSHDASDIQHAWQEEPPKKNREEEEELSAGGVCVCYVPICL